MPTRTYLEQTNLDELRPAAPPGEDVIVLQVEDCAPSLWRRLYGEVGAAYHWVDRLGWTDADIQAYLSDPAVSLWVLTVSGEVAGYFELRKHPEDEVRLKPDTTETTESPVASGFSRTGNVPWRPALAGPSLSRSRILVCSRRMSAEAWENTS